YWGGFAVPAYNRTEVVVESLVERDSERLLILAGYLVALEALETDLWLRAQGAGRPPHERDRQAFARIVRAWAQGQNRFGTTPRAGAPTLDGLGHRAPPLALPLRVDRFLSGTNGQRDAALAELESMDEPAGQPH